MQGGGGGGDYGRGRGRSASGRSGARGRGGRINPWGTGPVSGRSGPGFDGSSRGNYSPQQQQGSVGRGGPGVGRGGPAWRPGNYGSSGVNYPPQQQQQQGSVWGDEPDAGRGGPGVGRSGPAWRPGNVGSGGSFPAHQGSVWGDGRGAGRGGPAWRPRNDGSGGSYQSQQQQSRVQEGGSFSGRGGRAWGSPRGEEQYGSGSGGGGGSGDDGSGSHGAKLMPSPCPPAAQSTGQVVSKFEALKISEGNSPSSEKEGLVPIKRPDAGGVKKIREVNILVNHFRVEFNAQTVIRHYDIDVKPEAASAGARPVKMSKATLSLLKDKLFADNPEFPLEMTAYDGEKNVFSACLLPTGQFRVTLSDEEDMRHRSFIFSIKLVNELKLCRLKDYLTKTVLQLPREVLQGLDVVMKENPRRHMVSIGRTFHPFEPDSDLGCGLAASRGLQHSLKPTEQGLALCLDYSVLAVRKRISVLEFLEEHIYGFNYNSFPRLKREIESALKGLKVTVTHRRTKQKYVVSGLTDRRACDITFTIDDPEGKMPSTSVYLLDYFRDKYPQVNIQHRTLPCLNLGKGGRVNYVPIELCVLVEGQRFPKEDLEYDAAKLLKNMSLTQPVDRREKICGMVRHEHGPCGGEISKNFGMNVGMQMTRVKGRVINPPQLILGSLDDGRKSPINVDREKCDWNLMRNSVVEGKSLLRWAVLDLSFSERYDRLNDQFIPKLVARCKKLGLNMEKPLFTEGARLSCLASAESVMQLFDKINKRAHQAGKGNLQLLLCVMTKRDPGYKHIKWVSETKIGFITQCCISKMANKGQDQYMANLGMKINAKLGGINVDLAKPLTLFEDGSDVMVIGADVNHPRASDISSPSIAAVVASTNRRVATKYIARLSFQAHRKEEIIGFGNLCWELIEAYEKINSRKPQRLVIFRDGVSSEGQFNMVLREELLDLKKVMQARDYYPTVTLLVARKRHLTRLFPETVRDAGRSGNVPPGTVVDKIIVHPSEFDFYLCSHYGMIGTSKPTLYQALWDEHNFSSDSLQEFIYNLCFTFARCCKPVSLVTPVYYADLLAYRGRLYYEAQTEGQYSSGASFSSCATSSSTTSGAFFDENLYRLHSGIENGLYFI